MTAPNPFTDPEIVAGYETWYQTVGRKADWKEKTLLKQLMRKFPAARSILEIGCGSGHFMDWFTKQGLQSVGLDLSRPMLEEAKRLRNPLCLQGNACMLPFRSASFDLVALITALEFIPYPIQALAEANRVARQGLILGVLNAQSSLGRQYKKQGGLTWNVAHFFTVDELKRIIQEVTEKRPEFFWRTTLWSLWPGALPLPWGGFIGMAIKLS